MAVSEAVWALFAEERPFRHAMNLRRLNASEFYAPTNEKLLAERTGILAGPDGDKRSLSSAAGAEAHEEFCRLLGRRTFEPDLLFLLPPDWLLAWACVCFPTHWSLEGKLGRPLSEIHGAVPELNPQIGANIASFLDRLAPGDGWSRLNWGLSASPERDQHPDRHLPHLSADTAPETAFLRLEHQHLLKLPQTGALAFGIRIETVPLAEILAEPALRSGLLARLRSMPAEIAAYKGLAELRWN